MSGFIVEYIGKNKIIHTNTQISMARWEIPQPGDVVWFGTNYSRLEYPYNIAEYGRFDNQKDYKAIDKKYTICVGSCSAFLSLHQELDGTEKIHLSISGGPFANIEKENTDPTWTTKVVRFWNWGNNLAGAHQGVDFYIERPVFKYNIKE